MKLSVFTVVTPDLTPEQTCVYAKEAGLEGIEWRCKEVPDEAKEEAPSFWRNNLSSIHPEATDEEIARFRHSAESNGLRNVLLSPYLKEGDLVSTERAMRIAKGLGASMLRVAVPRYDRSTSYSILLDQCRAYLREVEKLANELGLKAVIHIHHQTIAPSASLAYPLIAGFDPQRIGVIYDPGNMVHEGFENYKLGLELLGPYVAHVHVKNAGWAKSADRTNGSVAWKSEWLPFMEGIVPWKQVLKDLKSVGYDGWLSLSCFGGTYPTKALLQDYVYRIHEMLQEVK